MEHPADIQPLPIPGLTFRRYQGERDLPAMLDVFQSLAVEDHDNVLETLADITNKYRHLANCDPYQDVLIAEVNNQMVAYSRVGWRQLETSDDRIYFMEWAIRPEWQRQGLEKTFLSLSQERLRQVIGQQAAVSQAGEAQAGKGEHGAESFSGRRFFEAHATNLQPELAELLEENGFQAVRWGSKMTCPNLEAIPDVPLPLGLEVRPVKPEQIRLVWDAMWEAFNDDPDYVLPTDDDYVAWQQGSQFQPGLWQVAWEGSQVAGMVLNYITHSSAGDEAGLAWTEDICVRRPWRRRGLARALLARSKRMFREMGFTQTSLGVDLHNPHGARQLYEAMGYQLVNTLTIYRKAVD